MDNVRYGVFLRPDPATCWAITQFTGALRAQFGLVSAGAFPPHATLVGNLRAQSEDEVVAALDAGLQGIDAVPLHNTGPQRVGACWLMDVHTDGDGEPNAPLLDLANRVRAAVTPLSLPHDDYLVTPLEHDRFWAHLSLASHDLTVAPMLSDEVGAYIAGLPIEWPTRSLAEVVTLFEFRAEWRGEWWHDLTWKLLRSWTLPVRGEG